MAEQALRQRPASTPEDLAMIQRIKDQTGHDATRISLVRARMASAVGKDVPLRDVLLFMMVERELGLDSLLGQIHWIYRSGKGGHQVGIDGFRAIADRSGSYAGSEPPVYRGTVEQPYGDGKQTFTAPEEAMVLVRKLVQGHVCSFVGVATWVEYYPSDDRQNFMWRKMPRHMLGKVAEANALRKAFPSQLAGLPLADDEPSSEPTVRVVENLPSYDQIYAEQDEDFTAGAGAPQVEEEEVSPPTPPTAAAPLDPWVDNRTLYFDAMQLGLRPKVLRNTTAPEQVEAYNEELRGQIAARRMATA